MFFPLFKYGIFSVVWIITFRAILLHVSVHFYGVIRWIIYSQEIVLFWYLSFVCLFTYLNIWWA